MRVISTGVVKDTIILVKPDSCKEKEDKNYEDQDISEFMDRID
jgi:hypothetical protein